jgi:CRISPR/Cas system-associated protein Cas10 (large subunit of type III CRISPR-Cas system)
MAKAQGGTRLWCPTCKMDTICAAIPIDPDARSKRIQRKATLAGDGELHHFDRVRKCTICGEEFETVEIELRDAMKVIRDKADALILWQK